MDFSDINIKQNTIYDFVQTTWTMKELEWKWQCKNMDILLSKKCTT